MSEHAPANDDLTGRSITGMLWGVAGTFARALLQIGAQVVLARLLGPEPYGLFAVAVVVIVLSGFFADVGLAYSLIQRPRVSDEDIRFVFSWQIVLGAAVTGLLLLTAPWFGAWMGEARSGEVVAWLAWACVINALGATAQMLLRRQMRFKALNLASVLSYALGFVGLGIPMAVAGYGVEALVVAYLAQALFNAVFVYGAVRHPLRLLFVHPPGLDIVRFGLTAFVTSVLNWVMSSLDRVAAGLALTATGAGLYAVMSNFVTTPSLQLLSLLQGVFYSASAGVQDSVLRLRHGLRSMFAVVALVAAPVFAAMAAVAGTIIETIYGPAWLDGALVFAALSLAMPAFLIMGMAVPVLWASGRIQQEFRLQVPLAVIWLLVLYSIVQWPTLARLAWGVFALYWLRAGVIVAATMRAVQLPAAALPALWRAPAMITVMVAAIAWAVDWALMPVGVPAPVRLALVVLACAIGWLGGIVLCRRWLAIEAVALLSRLASKVTGTIGASAIERWLGGDAASARQ
ncbi:MAG: oligosaccharide flippase family protein [Burkholderiaceae bacterium]